MGKSRKHVLWAQIYLFCTKCNFPSDDSYFAFHRVTEREIKRIEELTRHQGRIEDEELTRSLSQVELQKLREKMTESTKMWHRERKLRITASNFGSVMSLRDSTPCVKRVADLVYYKEDKSNQYFDYGKENEPKARKLFSSKTGKRVSLRGLCIDKDHNYLAASCGK